MTADAILERVRKLRALTKSNNQHEAAAAARLLAQHIEKYRLSEADLDRPSEDSLLASATPIFHGRIGRHDWILALANAIGTWHGCVAYTVKDTEGLVELRLVGIATDEQLGRDAFQYWYLETDRLCRAHRRGQLNRSWCMGMVAALEEAYAAGQEDARVGASSRALTVLDGRLARAQQAFQALLGGRARKPRPAHVDLETWEQGRVAGLKRLSGDS